MQKQIKYRFPIKGQLPTDFAANRRSAEKDGLKMSVSSGQCIIYSNEKREPAIQLKKAILALSLGVIFGCSFGLAVGYGSQVSALKEQECDCQCPERVETPAPTVQEPEAIAVTASNVLVNLKPKEEMTLEDKICAFTDWDCKVMIAIAKAESGLRCDAFNDKNSDGSTDSGLFQINSVHEFGGDLMDCDYNIEVAHKVWLSQGYPAWVVFNTGKYLQFIK